MTIPQLPQEVRETRARLTALLRTADPDAAAWVERVGASPPEVPTVVVVGETNRGKSSLVNALLATPQLSPVEADAPTATYLVLRHAEQWSTQVFSPGLHEPVSIPRDELARWVCALDTAPPRYVEVRAPIPLLERLTLVDTPGVGGLDAAHGELALEAARAATALLFVVDAGAPFTRGELDFLRRLADHVETVVFALSKIDLHHGWRQILDADQALLARHAPRLAGAPFLPVSARLFESAAAAPTADVGALLRERSGIAELQTALQRQVGGRAAMLGEANVLRAIATALAGTISRLHAQHDVLASVEHSEASTDALRRRRDELTAQRRAGGRSWQVRLRGEVQRARLESQHDVAGQIRSAQTWFRRAVDQADRAALARLPYQLDAALQLMSARITEGLAHRLSRVVDAALAELFTPAELDAVRAEFARRSDTGSGTGTGTGTGTGSDTGAGSAAGASAQPLLILRPPDRRPASAEDKILVAMGVSGGLGLARLALPFASLGAAAGIAVLPVTIVLGLGAGWWLARARRHTADKAHLRQWLTDILTEARSTLDQVVAEQMIDAEQQLSLALDEALARRVAAMEDGLREVDRALRMDAADRNRALADVRTTLAEATAGRKRAEQLLARIRSVRDRA